MLIKSIFFMSALNVIRGGITLILSFLIAKFITPSEYGIVTFTLPFIVFFSLLTDLGIANAIIREPTLTRNQSGSAFVLMLYLGGFFTFLLLALSRQFEDFTSIIGLAPVLKGFSAVLFFQIASTVPKAILEREQSYSIIAKIEFFSLLTAICSFYLAIVADCGVMSIVVYHLVLQLIRAIILFIFSRRMMGLVIYPKSISSLVKSGSWIFGSSLLSFASRNIDKWLIGVCLGQGVLGLYGFAYQMMTIPLTLIAWPASNILLSSLSKLAVNNKERKRILLSFIGITSLIAIPIAGFLSTFSEMSILMLGSERWLDASKFITILMPLGIIQSFAVYATTVLVTNAKYRTSLIVNLLNGIIIPLAIYIVISKGIGYVVVTYFFTSFIISTFSLNIMCKVEGIRIREFMSAIFLGLMPTTFALILSFITSLNLSFSPLYNFIIISLIFFIAFTFALFIQKDRIFKLVNSLMDKQ